MKKLSYDELNKKIKDYYINNVHSEFILIDQNDKERRLNQIISYDSTDQEIGLFKVVLVDDLTIMEFEIINLANGSKTDNVIISRNLKPIFMMQKLGSNKMNIPYQKEKFSMYNEKYDLVGYISYEDVPNSLNIKVTNRRNNNGESYSKNYTFYSDDSVGIYALKVDDDDMNLMINNGFIRSLEAAYKLIDKVSTKINNKVDSLIGIENIKEYQISRGKRRK